MEKPKLIMYGSFPYNRSFFCFDGNGLITKAVPDVRVYPHIFPIHEETMKQILKNCSSLF